ncbi:MAG: sugar ABC transporter ATP-binding protein [Planctomycetota bacterium]
MSSSRPAPRRLRIEGAAKRYGGVRALRGVDLAAEAGEVHAILGENGAGKSTLMKVLAGAVRHDEGLMWIDGEPYAPRSPRDAREAGIAMIYQELNLCPHLSVLENVALGAERTTLGFTRHGETEERLRRVLDSLEVRSFEPRSIVETLGPGDRQLVEIARALVADARIIVFDEPTSSLSRPDVERLFRITRRLSEDGVTVLWISHFLDEVKAVADRFTVLRDGLTVGDGDVATTSTDEMVARMVGRSIQDVFPRAERTPGEVVLTANGLAGDGSPRDASFELRAGEILGVFGLVGAGRTETLRCLFGLDRLESGTVEIRETRASRLDPRAWVRRGVGLVSEDRAREGVALELSIAENVTLSTVDSLAGPGGAVTQTARANAAAPWIERLALRCGSPHQPVRELSGGNQQKVALARLLESRADVLLLDEPTRGIDVGAKVEVYRLLDELARDGKAILVVSSQMPELIGLCDRIAVMHRGTLGPARPTDEWTEEAALAEATAGAAR